MIDNLLSQSQIDIIVATISSRCNAYRELEKRVQSFYYEPYTTVRRKENLTSAVLSGFAPGKFQTTDITPTDINYGLNDKLCQPELHTDKAILQIYSDGAVPLNNQIVKARCEEYNGEELSSKRFLLVIFHASKEGVLNSVEVLYPNSKCAIIERKEVYTKPILVKKAI